MESFKKRIPSVFSIQSPFQALCAVAAIRQLEIRDYRILVLSFKYFGYRNAQIVSLLNQFNISYKIIKLDNLIKRFFYIYKSRMHHINKYERLFVGDFRYILPYIIGFNYVSDGSTIVNIDDGNVSVSYLSGVISNPMSQNHQNKLKMISQKRDFVINQNFFTVYTGIHNSRYNIELLDLSFIVHKRDIISDQCEEIFFIGTNPKTYCDNFKIMENLFYQEFESVLRRIKTDNYNDKIIFIPHGFDNSLQSMKICNKLGIEYRKTKDIVEMEIMRHKLPPKSVYGFTSSALYNIKKIYPQSEVINILIDYNNDNDAYKEFCQITEYYKENGIVVLNVVL